MSTDTDPEAPYGRHPDGTPKRSNGGRPKATNSKPTGKRGRSSSTRTAPTPNRKAAPNAAPKKSAADVDFTDTFTMLFGLAGAVISPASPLDGYTLMTSADALGSATNDLAQINPYVRKMAEKAMTVGPYGGIVAKLTQVGAQIAENHGWLPPQITTKLGAVPRQELISRITAEQGMAQAQARAAQQSSDAMGFGQASDVPYPSDSADPPFIRTDYATL